MRTSIKEVPVANEKLYGIVAHKCDISPKQVEECIDILGKFIKATMESGTFDAVMIPYFGKIMVSRERLQWINHSKVMPHIPTHLQPRPMSAETAEAIRQLKITLDGSL